MDTKEKYIQNEINNEENNKIKLNEETKIVESKIKKIKFLEDEDDYCEILFLTGC